jgi:hypothetical protein
MKLLIIFTIFITSISSFANNLPEYGNSIAVLQTNNNWIQISGKAAKALYDSLNVPAKNDQGEAGADIYFKRGSSYQCSFDVSDPNGNYACTLFIADPEKGIIRNLSR